MSQRVLVVDDHQASRQAMRDLLESEGMQVVEAATATEALVKLSETTVDVLVADYLLPDRNGAELTREVREKYPKMRVVVVTGSASYSLHGETVSVDTHERSSLAAGAERFLSKPTKPDVFLKAVRG